MKKYLLLAITGLAFNAIQAQNQNLPDALLYAQTDLGGTARFRAMSGAFGALGGDFSSLNINPAGGAIFTTSQIAVTLNNDSRSNKSNYFGTATKEDKNSFDLGQIAAVWVFENYNSDSGWNKFSIGANYENRGNFDNRFYSQGHNPTNSISNYFLDFANNPIGNTNYNQLNYGIEQTNLGYEGYVINQATDPAGNSIYTANTPNGGNYYQENFVNSSGYNGKLTFNIATQYKDKFYFGLNLNSHFTDYTRKSSFYEDYLDTPGTQTALQRVRFDNELYRYGNGFSFQVGAIAKVTNSLRAGLAYESPTWYNFTEDVRQTISSNLTNAYGYDTGILTYPDYRLQTPGKYTGSLAYVFGKIGLISIDYAMKDYSNTKYGTDFNNTNFSTINNDIETLLDATSEVRIGAETRVKQWSFRAGYRFEQSPYKNGKTVGDLNSFSGGLGYNFGPVRADASYAYAKRDSQMPFFSTGLNNPANIKSVSNSIALTLLFEM